MHMHNSQKNYSIKNGLKICVFTGNCTVLLKNGDEIEGNFKKDRLLQGIATIEGTNMEQFGLASVR